MQSNMLMLSWVVGALPTSRSQALLCSAGSVGYTALRQSLSSSLYPQHTILLTNVDVRDIPTADDSAVLENTSSSSLSSPPDTPCTSGIEEVVQNGEVHEEPIADNAMQDAFEDAGEPYSFVTRIEDWRKPHHICTLLNTPLYYYLSDCTYDHSSLRFGIEDTAGIALAAGSAPRTHIVLFSNVAEIPKSALDKCTAVTAVDFGGMCNVRSLGQSLLYRCDMLKYVNLPGMHDVAEIPSFFMHLCRTVKVISLAPFTNVTKINSSFLYGCSSLEMVDLTPLANITEIPKGFLSACGSLKTIDFTPMTKVTKMGTEVLSNSFSLASINLDGLGGVTAIPHDFLRGCSKLTIVDYTPMKNAVVEVPPQ